MGTWIDRTPPPWSYTCAMGSPITANRHARATITRTRFDGSPSHLSGRPRRRSALWTPPGGTGISAVSDEPSETGAPGRQSAMTELVEHGQLFIGGELTGPLGKDVIEVISPHTEEVIGRVPHASREDVDRAVAVARRAFDEGPWPRMTLDERIE